MIFAQLKNVHSSNANKPTKLFRLSKQLISVPSQNHRRWLRLQRTPPIPLAMQLLRLQRARKSLVSRSCRTVHSQSSRPALRLHLLTWHTTLSSRPCC